MVSQPDAMEEDGMAAAVPVPAPGETEISQSAAAFQIATEPLPDIANDHLLPDGASTSLSTTQTASTAALLSTETPPPLVQPQPASPSAVSPAVAQAVPQQTQPVVGTSPSPLPARTSTPMRSTGPNNAEASSRATSQHPPDTGFVIPGEATPHGAPARQYLNTKVTGALLEGMKIIAKDQPKDPLRVLGEFLLQRSRELEPSA